MVGPTSLGLGDRLGCACWLLLATPPFCRSAPQSVQPKLSGLVEVTEEVISEPPANKASVFSEEGRCVSPPSWGGGGW